MAKIKIEISDKDDGSVGIVFTPRIKELAETSSRMGEENTPASFWYAITAANAFKKMNQAAENTDREESAKKAGLWMPGLSNIKKLFS